MNNASLFLLNIEEKGVECITVNSIVTAALVVENTNSGKITVTIADRIPLDRVIVKARSMCPNVKPAHFFIKNGQVKGNGLVSLKPLLSGGTGTSVAVAEIKRYGKNEVAGYVLCDRVGRIGKLSKANVLTMLAKNSDFVTNIKVISDSTGKQFCALKETKGVLTYTIGLEESKKNIARNVTKPAATNSKQTESKKAAVLNRIKGSRLGKYLSEDYSLDCMMFLVTLAKNHVRYDHLLNPKYNVEQMAIIHTGYCEGLDISKYSDPNISAKGMNDMYIALKNGMWEDCLFIDSTGVNKLMTK